MMNGIAVFYAIIGVSAMFFAVGTLTGATLEERKWQRVLIEKYDATYCDGEFSLGECK